MSEETRDEKEMELKVTDRRQFTSDGELRHPVGEEQVPDTPPQEKPVKKDAEKDAGFQHEPVEEPIGVDFPTLTLSLAQSALFHLGEVPHPEGGKSAVNLEQAQVSIDFLALLKVKCRGNLNRAEEEHLDRILAELRLLYVRKSATPKTATPDPGKG